MPLPNLQNSDPFRNHRVSGAIEAVIAKVKWRIIVCLTNGLTSLAIEWIA